MKKAANKKNMTIEDLADSVNTLTKTVTDGFYKTATKNDIRVLKIFMQQGFDVLNTKIDVVEGPLTTKIEALDEKKVFRHEYEQLENRVIKIEHRLKLAKK